MTESLRFLELASAPDVSFWARLAELKLNEYKLSEDPIPVVGHYRASANNFASPLILTSASFDLETTYENQIRMEGEVVLLNTLESMKTFERKKAGLSCIERIDEDVGSGAWVEASSKLNRFVVVCFADLKQYTFYYWVCVPAVKAASPMISKTVEEGAGQDVCTACYEYYKGTKGRTPFWIVEGGGGDTPFRCRGIGEYDRCEKKEEVIVAFVDPSDATGSPGWPLRNFLWFVASSLWGAKTVRVLCLKEEKLGRFSTTSSVLHTVDVPPESGEDKGKTIAAVGWEHNAKGGLGPRSVNLASTLDPKQRASAAMDLNLKLMRWRALPELQVDRLSKSKCLLLGAGTLGCAVSRILQGWGCRKITFVDSGKVAFSNPVRQSLFEFTDCLEGGKPKAQAAADALKKIFPDADSSGVQLTIPMPGHPVKEGSKLHRQTMETVSSLDALVKDHDIVFLLTDTRESRWLPTLLSLAHGKLAVSVALGFDTFLVMRHGCLAQGEKRLGCYFCNDVAAPLNSTKNRTLDQQCTVVRPGLASIASALAVELVSSILQHPMKGAASDEDESILGGVPHSIRGFLDSFEQLKLSSPAFGNCVGCSERVLASYADEKGREAFLTRVFNEPEYLEELTGLTELKRKAQEALEGMEIESDEDDTFGDGGGGGDDDDDFQIL
ncbi:ubiquitin-like modifier-activating enzyme Atg7 [Chloropicon primus]|uniref:Ubiquitin-like modifier-activating enzyme ATG7 n=2 Tax=Chloropicon primus TaxID=1764295 RepID=A0A5B8MJ00_9CHLO|nr:ubiquitin-like modifier-activating enzyme Atg7 [Chloropicon primus]UPQ99588.1 ubiquitin-like modifier-activating enzyme Atg7 [Chloropicon primus]|eukprot:QDZ20379.1 ubiquitin-like modifier-activating enzyme Atg7 [Chloropicon primus]